MADVAIRPAAGAQEIEAAGQVVADAYEAGDFGEAGYRATIRDARDRARQAILLVAVDAGGLVLGTVTYARPGSAYAEVSRSGESEFRMLGVSPAALGRGIGLSLVEECLRLARADGSSALVLCTLERMTAARSLYGRLGFERAPDRDWSPAPGIDLLGYVLTL